MKIHNYPLLNPWNLLSIFKIFKTFKNPLDFFIFLLNPKKGKILNLRTPIGNIKILLRNRESARTVFSIFIREDYLTNSEEKNILDLGSNIGISAAYFLSRNKINQIFCVEPDPNNIEFLKANLEQFTGRYKFSICAIGSEDSQYVDFNISNDGKYSSIRKIGKKFKEKIKVKTISIKTALSQPIFQQSKPILLKIDTEGTEGEILKNLNFNDYPFISELIVEGVGFKKYISRECKMKVVNGYIERFNF